MEAQSEVFCAQRPIQPQCHKQKTLGLRDGVCLDPQLRDGGSCLSLSPIPWAPTEKAHPGPQKEKQGKTHFLF